jgi:hypothetical protein
MALRYKRYIIHSGAGLLVIATDPCQHADHQMSAYGQHDRHIRPWRNTNQVSMWLQDPANLNG